MRVLLVHNKYQYAGGEDIVFEAEAELLQSHGHSVERLIFDNKDIASGLDKILSGLMGIYNVKSARKLQRKINEFLPDIIHVHNFVPLASPAIFFVAKRNGIPAVFTLHNYRLICPSATLFYEGQIYEKSVHARFPIDAVLKGVYRSSKVQTAALACMMSFHNIAGTWKNKVAKFIVLTEFAMTKFKDSVLRVEDDQLALKPNFIADPGYDGKTREDFFLYVGRLSEEKGIETLLKACQLGNFKLTIIGDGPLRAQVEQAVALNDNIEYLGFLKKDVILDSLRRCKALIFPSVWFEGFPITILEAFATGTPIIGSRIGSVAEIIEDQVNGLHFEPGNENDLVLKIDEIQQPGRGETLSANARDTYLTKYTPEKNYVTLMEIYDSVQSAGKPTSDHGN